MGMSRAAKMVMTGYRSRNENRNEGQNENRNENYRNEGYRNENYRNENYQNEGNQMEMAEMRRRRDSRGRFMEGGMDMRGEMENRNEMRDYRNEGENRRGGYRDEMEGYGGNRYQAESRMESREEYPKPHLLPRKQPIGFMSGSEQQSKPKPIDRKVAREWIESMKSEDEQGAPWISEEDVKPFMMQVKFEGNPAEFWAIMNAVYTDYSHVARRYGINKPEFYAELAKAWLEDEDAVPDKAAIYYDCIVKH